MSEEPIGKEGTQMPLVLVVPVVEGLEMDKMMDIINAVKTEGKCGFCDHGFGISWCNHLVPHARYKLALSREF